MIIKNRSILGVGVGRLGDFIVYKYRNRMCVRSRPAEVKFPGTPGQLAQQARMASVAVFYHALKEAGLYPYWKSRAEELSRFGYNLLVQADLPAFGGDGGICDFSKLWIVRGSLALPNGLALSKEPDGGWRLTWNPTSCHTAVQPDDLLRLYVMKDSESFDVVPLETEGCCRGDGQCVFRLPGKFCGFPHLYVFFCSHTGEKCSDSRYFLLTHKF